MLVSLGQLFDGILGNLDIKVHSVNTEVKELFPSRLYQY